MHEFARIPGSGFDFGKTVIHTQDISHRATFVRWFRQLYLGNPGCQQCEPLSLLRYAVHRHIRYVLRHVVPAICQRLDKLSHGASFFRRNPGHVFDQYKTGIEMFHKSLKIQNQIFGFFRFFFRCVYYRPKLSRGAPGKNHIVVVLRYR